MRYTTQDKLLALGLLYKSPSAYRFMSRSFCLPSERTLQSYVGDLHVGCGFKSDYTEALKKRVESMNDFEKHCVLTFDGMSLKAKLNYNEAIDKIRGFVDLGEYGDHKSEVSKQAIQFMVRGISTKWKQPIGHFFGPNSVSAETLEVMVKDAVLLLENIGVKVVALVCDQEVTHRLLFKKLGVTVSEPWFVSSKNNKVFAMYDVPHLVKNLRNNMIDYSIHINGNIASFKHIRQMYDLEKNCTLRLCPKLTDGHFDLKPFKKMKVCLATQVFSHSVSTAMRTYVKFGQLDESALQTADFVELIDQLFDIMNSRSNVKHKWKKPLTANCLLRQALIEQ